MDIITYTKLLEKRLYPQPYNHRLTSLPDGIHLLLLRQQPLLPQYALAVSSWNPSRFGIAFWPRQRRALARKLGAMWLFREFGLYLVICGAESDWKTQLNAMPADKTGLHAVILQAVHFIDLDSGVWHLNQSAWGQMTFGGTEAISAVINRIPVN
jgi:hypothetical protein